jgi:hypothetical protein
VKNNSINENASVDDALFNPSSDTTRRGLLQNTRITKDAYSIPCSLFTRRDEHNKENEIELKDYDFITKLKKPDSTGNLLKQESLTIDFSEDIKAYRIGNRNINKRFQTEETKKILNMNTKEEKNNVCNSEQNKEFSLKNQGEKEILLIGNSDYTSEFKIIKNEDCKSKEIGKVKEKEKFLYNSVNQKKEFILEPEFDYDIKINFDVYSSEQFKNRLENTNYILNNKSVIEEKLGKKLSEKNSENSPKLLKKIQISEKKEQSDKPTQKITDLEENLVLEKIKSIKNSQNDPPVEIKLDNINNDMNLIEHIDKREPINEEVQTYNLIQHPKNNIILDVKKDDIHIIDDFYQKKEESKEPEFLLIDINDKDKRVSLSQDKIDIKNIDTNDKGNITVFKEIDQSNDHQKKVQSVTEENVKEIKFDYDKNFFQQEIRFLSENHKEPISDFVNLK